MRDVHVYVLIGVGRPVITVYVQALPHNRQLCPHHIINEQMPTKQVQGASRGDRPVQIGFTLGDTTQLAKQMTKDTRDTSHFDKSSQHTRQGSTKYRKDLIIRRNRHKPEHQMFFLLVFLQDKCL